MERQLLGSLDEVEAAEHPAIKRAIANHAFLKILSTLSFASLATVSNS